MGTLICQFPYFSAISMWWNMLAMGKEDGRTSGDHLPYPVLWLPVLLRVPGFHIPNMSGIQYLGVFQVQVNVSPCALEKTTVTFWRDAEWLLILKWTPSQVLVLHISSLYLGPIMLIDLRLTTTMTTAMDDAIHCFHLHVCMYIYMYIYMYIHI